MVVDPSVNIDSRKTRHTSGVRFQKSAGKDIVRCSDLSLEASTAGNYCSYFIDNVVGSFLGHTYIYSTSGANSCSTPQIGGNASVDCYRSSSMVPLHLGVE